MVTGLNNISMDVKPMMETATMVGSGVRPARPALQSADGGLDRDVQVTLPGLGGNTDGQVDPEQLQQMVEELNHAQVSVRFSMIEDSNRVSIQVIDPVTDDVLREIPPKAIVQAHQSLTEYHEALGLLVDQSQ